MVVIIELLVAFEDWRIAKLIRGENLKTNVLTLLKSIIVINN